MKKCMNFLSELGLGDAAAEFFDPEDFALVSEQYIEDFADVYAKNIGAIKDEFSDDFVVGMFLCFNTVFMRSDFCEMLDQVREQFGTDLWSEQIEYEWSSTGESAVFELMDSLEIGSFEQRLAGV